ncbi:hypothetical protein TRIATDRAFT_317758 [Trichoderma atroviride IMI 206040]|uniref:DUF6546 domain-containing protein n=1 Tax=Hypocrea atroviridis (strain ATCC 20476 / IMI 206040) TaxID=452589 RepID=G9NU70_HYPAI|nr:uncharacterized protein TRIATDRAFT_317758 [Trichoderma atroviride IMI 206040]EHK45603.1 hypothetical protein TRIATDRAFT_317758 [Trichoderma atroviride IMI 206040]
MPLANLPAEIKRMILEALVKDGRELARFAAVSREWQAAIEPQTFKRIKITPSRIAELDDMTRRNRSRVRYLWFCLELERYGCDTCSPEDGVPMFSSAADDLLIKTGIQSLFLVLGAWSRSSSLILDISVYSTSDPEHWFKYLTFEPDDDEDDVPRLDPAVPSQVDDDARHRWDTAGREVTTAQSAVQNVFTRILNDPLGDFEDEEMGYLGWWRELPSVPAVTRLLLRQQTRRRWEPEALVEMVALFPSLRELHFEPWREWDNMLQDTTDQGYLDLFESPIIRKLDRLTIFENFNQRYVHAYWEEDCDRIRPPNLALSRILSDVSTNYESLSASFAVDADSFFALDEGQPPKRWPNLKYLFLTSQLLAPDQDETRLTNMLRAAARAAIYMPNLETMQIWNGRKNLAALFKYEAATEGQPCTITWKGTWEFVLQASLIQAWQAVVSGLSEHEVMRVIYESIDGDQVRCHGDGMILLELPEMVIRRVSLRQIQREQMYIPLQSPTLNPYITNPFGIPLPPGLIPPLL